MINENNVELKPGYISNKDLALWFGIKPNSFAHAKNKKLEQLKKYADYEIIDKKIKINKVHIPYYSKSYTQVLNNMDKYWSEDGLDSCRHVSYILKEQLDLPVIRETIEKYACRGRNELWGKPFVGGGKMGACVYVWCKRFGEGINTQYELLTEQQEEIKQQLIKKYFGDATQKQIIVKGMVQSGEITKEEAWDVLTQLTNMQDTNFMTFLTQLQEKLQCTVVRGTLVERSAFELEENEDENKS